MRGWLLLAATTALTVPGVWGHAAAQSGLNVLITVELIGGLQPVILGRTNLPDGMELTVSVDRLWERDGIDRIKRGLPACIPDCIPEMAKATVRDGRFRVGPLGLLPDRNMQRGLHVLEITTPVPSLEPQEVRNAIGKHGENLAGPLVIELFPGAGRTVEYMTRVTLDDQNPKVALPSSLPSPPADPARVGPEVAPAGPPQPIQPRSDNGAVQGVGRASSYDQGYADRMRYQGWRNSFPPGRFQEGVFYWEGNRSLPGVFCPSDYGHDFYVGCVADRRMIAPYDARRLSDPAYRAGWNAVPATD